MKNCTNQWFSTFFGWRHIFHTIIFGDTFLSQNACLSDKFVCSFLKLMSQNNFATHWRKPATHKCVATPYLRNTGTKYLCLLQSINMNLFLLFQTLINRTCQMTGKCWRRFRRLRQFSSALVDVIVLDVVVVPADRLAVRPPSVGTTHRVAVALVAEQTKTIFRFYKRMTKSRFHSYSTGVFI